MATAVLFIGWNRPHVGKDADAWGYLMGEGQAILDKFKAEGYFESQERIGLTAHGGDLNFMTLLFGERAKLDEMRRTDAFERFAMTLGSFVDGLGVVPGLNSAGIEGVMKRMQDRMP